MSNATYAIQHPRPDVDGSPRTATRTTAASDLTRPELASDTLRACLLRERSSPGRAEPRTSAARAERSGDGARPCKGAPPPQKGERRGGKGGDRTSDYWGGTES